jgi:hypothetical protein
VLVGRSSVDAAGEAYAGLETRDEIKKYLIDVEGMKKPREVEAKAAGIYKARQVEAALAKFAAAGATAVYRNADVTDAKAFAKLVKEVLAEFGHVDGVIHAAGILEDKRFKDMTPEQFARVYKTKAAPVAVIAKELLGGLKLLVLFSSMTSTFGNVGQCNYGAGNSVLDAFAWLLGRKRPELEAVAFNWGPWKGAGMVNAGLEREFNKKGIGFLPLQEGSEFFANELAHPTASNVIAITGDATAIQETIVNALG